MSDSGKIVALQALIQGDATRARRFCMDMSRAERARFARQMLELREILDDLNADRCLHCGKRIEKVPSDRVRNRTTNADIWYHPGINSGHCPEGDTMAEPAPHED